MDRKTLGQLFLVGFKGSNICANNWIVKTVKEFDLAGVLLFDRNIDGSVQNFSTSVELKCLISKIKYFADKSIFIAVDQEGGRVCRLKASAGFPAISSAKKMADDGLENTKEQAGVIAGLLKEHGVNLNFAPVVDLNLNKNNPIIAKYNRSFSASAYDVVAHAECFIEQHHNNGIGCCIKHFPGHGSATGDSHKGFVDITECWERKELEPYQYLIDKGYEDGIMTAHLVNRQLDESGLPATLSPIIIHNIIRKQYNFAGVIFSDDMQMSAITNGWSYREAVKLAVLAGVDVIVVGNNLHYNENVVSDGVDAVEELIEKGQITEEKIMNSVRRIINFKNRVCG